MSKDYPDPETLSETYKQAGRTVLSVFSNREERNSFVSIFSKRDNKWNQTFSRKGQEDFVYPESDGVFTLPKYHKISSQLLTAFKVMFPHCLWDIESGTLSYRRRQNASDEEQKNLQKMYDFLKGIWLEYASYDALEQALIQIGKRNKTRMNYQLRHSVYIRRADSKHRKKDRPHGDRIKPFELDVVAMLGYQILLVSCTTASSETALKHKAMEAVIRSRQLGGDEAKAIVLSRAHPDAAKNVQAEMEDEMGSHDLPLQVWGYDTGRNLPAAFHKHLTETLHWR